MFIPGFLSLFARWEKVLQALNDCYKIHYVESRDKYTSRINRNAILNICEMSKDLDIIEMALELDKRKYITISSSMGASMVLENLAKKSISPIGAMLIGPMTEMKSPKWIPALLKILPPFVVNWFKPLMKWGIRNKMVDKEKEPEQVDEYIKSINAADCLKLKKWMLHNANKYNCTDILKKINDRIILIGTTSDLTHDCKIAINIAHKLINCTYIELRSNKAAHDLAFVDLAYKFIKELAGSGPKLTEYFQ
ncbi:MAG: lysophospholipase [Asgard group archaeon]|nr:lysophospholipase [Asgard group archaeon]